MRMRRTTLFLACSLLCGSVAVYTLLRLHWNLESVDRLNPRSSSSSSSVKGVLHMPESIEVARLGLTETLPGKEDSEVRLLGEEKGLHFFEEEEEEVHNEDGASLKEKAGPAEVGGVGEEGGGVVVKIIEKEEDKEKEEEQEQEEEAAPQILQDSPKEVAFVDAGVGAPLLRILVLTYKRAESLARCLQSLNAALYDGLPAAVEIHVDRAADGSVHNDTVTVAREFSFKHGASHVVVRPRHGGVVGQWLGSWKVPQDDSSEMAVFLEDDLTVSPYFARWLRRVHAKYDSFSLISGYSLQGETVRHASGTGGGLMEGPADQQIFAYPVLGSWGFSPNTPRWREFLRWYGEASKDEKFVPLVPGLKTTEWFRQLSSMGRKDSMWTQWHVYHTNKLGQFTLYPHFPDKQGLSFNWKEAGEHYSGAPTGKGLKERLLTSWPRPDLSLPDSLVVMDAKGRVMGQKLTPAGLQ